MKKLTKILCLLLVAMTFFACGKAEEQPEETAMTELENNVNIKYVSDSLKQNDGVKISPLYQYSEDTRVAFINALTEISDELGGDDDDDSDDYTFYS